MANATNFPSPLDDFSRFKRYLCSSDDLSSGIAECVTRMSNDERGDEIIKTLLEFSSIANKKLLVGTLAMCTAKNLKTKQAAYGALGSICTTPPLLFHFLDSVAKQSTKGKSGFGRVKRKAVARWYNSRSLKDLAMFVTRYRRRSNWSHVDLIRLAHAKPGNPGVDFILKYVTKGLTTATESLPDEMSDELREVVKYLDAVETVKRSHDEHEVARLVQAFQLTHEHVPTWFIKESKEVWSSLLPNMSLSSVLSHLNKMASIGLLDSGSCSSLDAFKNRLSTDDALLKELQPFSIQIALKSYEGGKTRQSLATWIPNPDVMEALRTLFYKAISLYEPSGRHFLVAVNVSSSMFNNTVGAPPLMTSIWAAASQSMAILQMETNRHLLAVGAGTPVSVDLTSRDLTVEQICTCLQQKKTDGVSALSKVFDWTQEKKADVDVFVIFTDQINLKSLPEDFRKYCAETKRPSTRLVVVLLGRFHDKSIYGIEHGDPGVLILRGLNPAVPNIISHFVAGKLDSDATG